MKLIALIISIMMLLSSCNFLPVATGDDLLEAPMMNQMQKEVYEALSLTLDTSQVVYAHPQSGEHRSPFIFYDLDGDKKEEAIVFYSYSSAPEELFAKILKQNNGSWKPVYDITGKGPKVEFVEFMPLVSSLYPCIVIGWGENTKHGEKTMSIYSYYEGKLTEELEEPYKSYYINKDERKSLSDLILIQSGKENFAISLFNSRNNRLAKVDSKILYEETTDILQILPGKLKDGRSVLYIDEEWAGISVSYGTEVVSVDTGLNVIVGSDDGKQPASDTPRGEAFTQTFRKREILSVDFAGKGEVEVPRIKDSDNELLDTESNNNGVELIEYMMYSGESFTVNRTAAINTTAGYIIYFPDKWIEKVTIVKEPQRQEWRFCKINTVTGEAGTELFRVRVYFAQDYVDEFTKDDIFLGVRGLFSYYGYIPQTYNEPLAITQQEAEQLFALI